MTSVLLIDDDIELADLLKEYLEEEGFEVSHVANGKTALKVIEECQADLLVLDIMMPGMNGIEVLRRVRRESNIPILMLTARGDEVDRISGLDLGADDYLAKPCSPGELAARLRAIMRRTGQAHNTQSSAAIVIGMLSLDPARRTVLWDGRMLNMTGAEFNLLNVLVNQAGKTVSREMLCEQGLGRPLTQYDRAIDVHLSSIRHKIGDLPDGRNPILNIRGAGYQYVVS